MPSDIGAAVGNYGPALAALTLVSFAVLYVAWASRAHPVYRSSHLLEFPLEAVFDAYYPRPGQDLTGHRFEGLEFLFVGRGFAEVRLANGAILRWELSRPQRGAWIVGPITVIAHTFTAVDGGTRVDVEVACRFPRLWDRLTAPFMGWFQANEARRWLGGRSAQASRARPFPILTQSPLAAVAALIFLGFWAWLAGWAFALAIAFIFAAHGVGNVVAARWFGHGTSSLNLLGIANMGPPKDYREVAAKGLAGPFAGLLACAILFGGFALLQWRSAIALVPNLAYMHSALLAPIALFPGGVVVRAMVVSMGPHGRIVWMILGGAALAIGAYLFMWQSRNWVMMLVLATGALFVFMERFVEDDLPKMGWSSILAAAVVYISLIAGHFGLASLAQSALRGDQTSVVRAQDRVSAPALAVLDSQAHGR